MKENILDNELVIVQVPRHVRQKIKVLASLDALTSPQYLEWIIGKAYESKMLLNQKTNA